MHELMEAEGLIKGTSSRTETTLSEIKRRREPRQKRREGELKELAEYGGKGNRAVIRREGGITFLKDWNDLSGTPEWRDIGPTIAKSEKQGKEGSNQVGDWLERLSTKMIGTRSFAGRKLANVQWPKKTVQVFFHFILISSWWLQYIMYLFDILHKHTVTYRKQLFKNSK